MLELHPWFDMIRYARSGGEAMSIAVRIAGPTTKKKYYLVVIMVMGLVYHQILLTSLH